jgi:hypothetical protein
MEFQSFLFALQSRTFISEAKPEFLATIGLQFATICLGKLRLISYAHNT